MKFGVYDKHIQASRSSSCCSRSYFCSIVTRSRPFSSPGAELDDMRKLIIKNEMSQTNASEVRFSFLNIQIPLLKLLDPFQNCMLKWGKFC
jgi:hypothetical protein